MISQENRNKLNLAVAKLEKVVADMQEMEKETVCKEDLYCALDCVYSSLRDLRQYVYSVEDNFWAYKNEHANGHLPKLTASQLQKVLDNSGLDKDFEVQKPVVYVYASNKKTKVNF